MLSRLARTPLGPALLTALVLLTVIGAGAMAAAQTGPATASDARLYPLTPGSPLYGPSLDPRQLRDRQSRAASDPADVAPPADLLDQLRRARGAPKTPRPLSEAAPAQSGACTQWITNPGMTDTNRDGFLGPADDGNWYTDIPIATIDTAIFQSAPNAVRLQDGDEQPGQFDIDMISHDVAFNPADTDVSIAFRLFQTTRDPGYDFLYYGLATFEGANATLDSLLYWNVVPDQPPGAWNTVYDRINDPALMQLLKDTDEVGIGVWLVFFNNTDGVAPFVGSIIDDATVTTCNANVAVSGSVNAGGAPVAAEVPVLLAYANNNLRTFEVVAETATSASTSSYSFTGLRPLAGDGSDRYQAFFANDGSDDSRVSLWVGQATTSGATALSLGAMEIADVALSGPADEAQVAFPATFSWGSRGVAGERYYFCIYDPNTSAGGCYGSLSEPAIQLAQADMQAIFADFSYDTAYRWYVVVESPGGDAYAEIPVDYGFSFYERGVSFLGAPPPPTPTSPPPGGTPPAGSGSKDWTVMIYIAGDNNLGDVRRYPNPTANLQGQFNTLKRLAATYPNINLVTLTDFFDGSGTQLCHLKPDRTQTCQQLGERDTSDPATLTNFINSAMDRFPATRTMLIISDHGHAIGGVAADETTAPTATMDPAEITQALQNSRLATRKADILFYNTCLMGSFEIAFDAEPYANYMVASANELWVLSVYERVLPLIKADSTIKNNSREVAAGIVDAYRRSVQATGAGLYISSAAYDLDPAKVSAVNDALAELGVAITDGLTGGQSSLVRSTLDRIRGQVQVYDSSGNNLLSVTEDAFVDVRHLATLLSNLPDSSNGAAVPELTAIKTKAAALLAALGPLGGANSMVIASQQISGSNGEGGEHNLSNGSGLAIFMPNGSEQALNTGQQRALANLYLNGNLFDNYSAATQWDEALRLYTGIGGGSSPTGGPGRFVRGTLPIDGALPPSQIYMPLLRR